MYRKLYIVVIAAIIAAAAYGIVNKSSFTDMGRDMTYIEENAYVSQMTQSGVERALGVMP